MGYLPKVPRRGAALLSELAPLRRDFGLDAGLPSCGQQSNVCVEGKGPAKGWKRRLTMDTNELKAVPTKAKVVDGTVAQRSRNKASESGARKEANRKSGHRPSR